MNRDDRLALYEKLYLQEVDRREKISTRLNLPMAISVALLGLLSFLVQNLSPTITGAWQIVFWIFYIAACAALICAFIFFRLSWFGHTDLLMPTADDIEDHYKVLESHYAPYEHSEQNTSDAFRVFLSESYQSYATKNAINNDRRSYNLYRATVAITTAVCLAFVSLIPFQLAQKSTMNNQPIQEKISMTTQQPPPPPSGPGPRNVKGDVPIPKRPAPAPLEKKS